MRIPCRSGSVFLFVLGLTVIAVSLSFAFVISARLRREEGLGDSLRLLAQQAARTGTAHAIEVVTRDFLATPNRPASFGSRWIEAFGPIDSHLQGKDGAFIAEHDPLGSPLTRFEINENDVKSENRLFELYLKTTRQGQFHEREDPWRLGWSTAQGIPRWIEPGHYHADLVAKPISFHLSHPQPVGGGGNDPARAAGENHLPDVDVPLYLDERLRMVDDRAQARYRMRYAVSIEDLGGHLLSASQGGYTPPTREAPAAIPQAVDLLQASEIDADRAARYADSFTNLALAVPMGLYRDAVPSWLASASWRGLGLPYESALSASEMSRPILAGFAGGVPQIHVDAPPVVPLPAGEPNLRLETEWGETRSSHAISASGKGPRFTFDDGSFNVDYWGYQYSPFNRLPRQDAAPSAFDEGYTDTPWQVNLTTASARTVAQMLFAYLPQEVHTVKYHRYTKRLWAGIDPVTKQNVYNNPTSYTEVNQLPYPHIDLFSSPQFARHFLHLGGKPYPGSIIKPWLRTNPVPANDTPPVPVWADLPDSEWNAYLGAASNVNDWWTAQPMPVAGTVPDRPDWNPTRPDHKLWWDAGQGIGGPYTPLQDAMVGSMFITFPERGVVYEKPGPGGYQISVEDTNRGRLLDWKNGLWHEDSYWLDVANAFAMTVALTQYAHQRLDGRQRIGNETPGIPRWPNVPGDADYAARAGLVMLDTDRDGNGVPDSPSLLDSIPDIDRQFIKNLGEHPEPHARGARPLAAHHAVYASRGHRPELRNVPLVTVWQPGATIKSSGVAAGGTNSVVQQQLMELVVNDLRLSFFGASPQYPNFTGIDFDDDGQVRCSGYPGGSAAADGSTGYGPVVAPANRFSLTGCFVLQQARYYRMIVRAEVYDDLLQAPAMEVNLETVYAIDPAGLIYDVHGAPIGSRHDPDGDGDTRNATDQSQNRILFQRWLMNPYQGTRLRPYP